METRGSLGANAAERKFRDVAQVCCNSPKSWTFLDSYCRALLVRCFVGRNEGSPMIVKVPDKF